MSPRDPADSAGDHADALAPTLHATAPDSSAALSDHDGLVDVDPAHYEPQGELARGGMGIVLRARDRRVGRDVALKELLGQSPELWRRFEREARITGQLQHPSIVPVYEVGRWPDGRPFFAMKLVSGRPLDEVVEEAADADARLTLIPRILPAVEAMAYAHEHGVIHRDLKPANVLIGEFGETVVIDWGLAKGIDEPDDRPAEESPDPAAETPKPSASQTEAQTESLQTESLHIDDTLPSPSPSKSGSIDAAHSGAKLTVQGAVIGTPAYMPPEQACGDPVDARADVYSLGALLYHTLSGQPPYTGPTVAAILADVLTGPPPSLATRAPGVAPDLISIVDKAMAPDRDDRYQDAGDLARDLKAFTTGRLVQSHDYSSWDLVRRFVRRNRALSAAIAGLVVIAVVGSVAVLRAYRISERARTRAVVAEDRALASERAAHEQLAQVHWQAAVRRLRNHDHLGAAVLAAAALREQPANPAGPHHADGAAAAAEVALAGAGASWAFAHSLRFASHARKLPPHDDWLYDVITSADGRWVVTTGADKRAHIWDSQSGKLHRTLKGHSGNIFQAALNASGNELATSGYDGTVRLWSFPDGAEIRTLRHPTKRVYGVCYASDGTLVSAGIGGVLAFYQPSSGDLVAELTVTDALPWRLTCRPDEPVALLGTSGEEALLIDLRAREVVKRLPHVGSAAQNALFSRDGKHILTADRSGVVRRFDRQSGELLAKAEFPNGGESLALSHDGRWLALGTRVIMILDSATLRPVALLKGHGSSATVALAFNPEGTRLYSGALDGTVVEWKIEPIGEMRRLVMPVETGIDVMAISPNGRQLVSVGSDKVVRLWDLESAQLLHEFRAHTAPVRGLVFLDDERIATSGMDRKLRIHNLRTRESGQVIDLPHFGDELSLASDGKTMAVGSGDGNVLLYDTTSWEQRVIKGVHGKRAWWVGFEPKGSRLASASFDGTVAIADATTLRVAKSWKAHEDRVYDADWRPDGKELTTVDLDGWVRRWDPATGKLTSEWRVLDGERLYSLAWSADARSILITSVKGVRLYRPDGALMARLEMNTAQAAGWTQDGRAHFAWNGGLFLLPLDPQSWRSDPEVLQKSAEADAGTSLSSLLGMDGGAQ